MPKVPVMQQGGVGPGAALAGIFSQIPQLIQAAKHRQIQGQLQDTMAGNQELDIYRKMLAGDKTLASDPNFVASVAKVAGRSGIQLPWQQTPGGGLVPAGGGTPGIGGAAGQQPGAAAPGGAPQQPSGISGFLQRLLGHGAANQAAPAPGTAPKTGPALDANAFLGGPTQTDFGQYVQKNLVDVQATDPAKRQAGAEAILGRPLTPQEAQQLSSIPQQLPPVQQEEEQRAIDTVVRTSLDRAARTGTAAALYAAVQFNTGRLKKAGYNDDEINALLDPVLDSMSPDELAKVAATKAKSGLETAQASFIQQSAQAKIDEINSEVKSNEAHAQEFTTQADAITKTLPSKIRLMATQANDAFANDEAKRAQQYGEANYYSHRAASFAAGGNPRAAISALSAIRAASASTQAAINSLETRIGQAQNSLTYAANKGPIDAQIGVWNKEITALKTRNNGYLQSMDTLTTQFVTPAMNPNMGGTPAFGAPIGVETPMGAQSSQQYTNGQVYVDGNGHRARYDNGRWTPVP